MNRTGRAVAIGVGILCAAVAGCGLASGTGLPAGPSLQSWTALTANNALVTDPTSQIDPGQVSVLRDVATRTWHYLSGLGLDPGTHLPYDSVTPGKAGIDGVSSAAAARRERFTNPSLIGTYLATIVSARDLGLVTSAEALTDATYVVSDIEHMSKADGFLFRWYSTSTGAALSAPHGRVITSGYVSSVDNGWLAQGLIVARGAFPSLAGKCSSLLGAMQWQKLYDAKDNTLYNGYKAGGSLSKSTYTNAYSGPRIAYDMAIGSGKVPGSLWWGPNRTPPANKPQRQTPRGSKVSYTDPQNHKGYSVFEGHYNYKGIKFVPTVDGSLYQALAPELIVPEQTMAPNSLGLNDRNTALAQGAFGTVKSYPVWGWAPATKPGTTRYNNFGVPVLASAKTPVVDDVVTPYAAFLALTVIPTQANADIAALLKTYPALYTSDGFLDSVNIKSGRTASRFMAVSQITIMLAVDDAVDKDQLQKYFAQSSYVKVLAPYMSLEKYSI